MNREQCVTRVAELDVAIINVTAQLNALHGHKAETMYWLNQLPAPVSAETEMQVESDCAVVLD